MRAVNQVTDQYVGNTIEKRENSMMVPIIAAEMPTTLV